MVREIPLHAHLGGLAARVGEVGKDAAACLPVVLGESIFVEITAGTLHVWDLQDTIFSILDSAGEGRAVFGVIGT